MNEFDINIQMKTHLAEITVKKNGKEIGKAKSPYHEHPQNWLILAVSC